MASEINRICPYCGSKLFWENYVIRRRVQSIVYCDNDNCSVKPCTDSTSPSNVYAELLAITGDLQ